MNSVQESKNELDAAIRYAENAISSAKQTIESMEFRQEMAKKQYSEQTGSKSSDAYREAELEREVAELRDIIDRMGDDSAGDSVTIKQLREQVEFYKEAYTEMEVSQGKGVPTMPVIPKAVAIAIFREGMQHGVESACSELEGKTIEIDENEYCGGFEVTFTKEIDLDDELDLDWMRGKVGNYSEEFITGALSNLCADKEFECRIHGVDDHQPFEPEHRFDND
tara:strand:- start:36917 stop:37585 length:669 start_codon:yes stop_codon:yes gene_type:complete